MSHIIHFRRNIKSMFSFTFFFTRFSTFLPAVEHIRKVYTLIKACWCRINFHFPSLKKCNLLCQISWNSYLYLASIIQEVVYILLVLFFLRQTLILWWSASLSSLTLYCRRFLQPILNSTTQKVVQVCERPTTHGHHVVISFKCRRRIFVIFSIRIASRCFYK